MAKINDIVSSPDSMPLLEQLAGKGQGRVFELSIEEVRLGREDENDIVINDESVSRLHAKLERTTTGKFIITDNNSKNGVIVNKQRVQSCTLNHGDLIQLGHFVFRFRVPGISSPNIELLREKNSLSPEMGGFERLPKQNRKRIYLWGGVGIFLLVALMLNNEDSSKPKDGDRLQKNTEEAFKPSALPEFDDKSKLTDVSGLEDPIIKTEKEISSLENKESFVKESELYFRKGQRDYFNKNYHHAVDNFDAAISLWGQHPLAGYYKGLAIHESEVAAEKNREMGLKYYNSLQYGRAMYHFKSAIDYLSHTRPDNVAAKRMIQDCEKYIEFSRRKLKASELVP